MKKVLITGAGSYIGTQAAAHLDGTPAQFATQTLDVQGADWKQADFTSFNAVLHVAGIAHQRETEANAGLYYAINRDLALDVAEKTKAAGVEQFVLLSSMSVYGLTCGHITADTEPAPCTHYGKSKLQAERAIVALASDSFHVAILRPPMVYGKGCRGNYPRLSGLIQKLPVFPKVRNERSMLYIGCLCAFLARLLASGQGGLFFPQNREYVSTDELARQIALAHGKKLWQPAGFGGLIRRLSAHVGDFGKLFGSLTYDQALSAAFADEAQPSFAQTILATEARP